jgi:hypothetical protein
LFLGKPVFPHLVSCDEIALLKILLPREILGEAHPDGHHFKFYMKMIIKSKINLIWKTSYQYNETIYRPPQSLWLYL